MAEETQRIRIGLTGLAFVFLLVVLGAAITRLGAEDEPPVNSTVANVIEEQPTEPLAEIGAAPGESSASTNAVAAAEQQVAAEEKAAEKRAVEAQQKAADEE